jgi:hypothetical protein
LSIRRAYQIGGLVFVARVWDLWKNCESGLLFVAQVQRMAPNHLLQQARR